MSSTVPLSKPEGGEREGDALATWMLSTSSALTAPLESDSSRKARIEKAARFCAVAEDMALVVVVVSGWWGRRGEAATTTRPGFRPSSAKARQPLAALAQSAMTPENTCW